MPKAPSFSGRCSICGARSFFDYGSNRSPREAFACGTCGFTLRWRDQAQILVDEFGQGQAESIESLVSLGALDTLDIYEPALRGPFVTRLNALPGYVRSYFWPDRDLGGVYENGVRNEDLTRLTFPDNSFDIVLTSDVMEHLYDFELAFAEISRVLKPGGLHVFTIPNDYPFPDLTERRVERRAGEEVPIKPARYHNSGDGSQCLVYTDFGRDIVDLIDAYGTQTRVIRRSAQIEGAGYNATFVTRKTGATPATARSTRSAAPPECPICRSQEFDDFNGRSMARCRGCDAVERQRLMWMQIQHRTALREAGQVLVLSSLGAMAEKMRTEDPRQTVLELTGQGVTLASAIASLPDKSFDLIVHDHVLNSVEGPVEPIMRDLNRVLKDGGQHILSVPIGQDMSGSHAPTGPVRAFAPAAFAEMLARVWKGQPGDALAPQQVFSPDQLRRAAIPQDSWTKITSHSVFAHTKPARLSSESAT